MAKYFPLLIALLTMACESDYQVRPSLTSAYADASTGHDYSSGADTEQGTDVAVGTDTEDVEQGTDVAVTAGEDATQGTDAEVGTDVEQDTDTAVEPEVDSGPSDTDAAVDTTPTPVEIPCDATSGVRLKTTTVKDIWYDKLLNTDCKFSGSEAGPRCFPAYWEYQGALSKGGVISPFIHVYANQDCGSQIYNVLDDGKAKFWVKVNPDGISHIRSTKDIPPMFMYKGPYYYYLTGYYMNVQGICTAGGKTLTKTDSNKPSVSDKHSFAMDDGIAHLDKCPEMTNLNLFVAK